MRKSSVQLVTQTSEPLIVVDEDGAEDRKEGDGHSSDSSSEDSPTSHFQNQFLLSPWRDARETRKLSLPSPQCTGITASQVRRLSERETGGPGPRQTEFLATLCQTQGPIPTGRRHSVVTICKLPSVSRGSRRGSVAVGSPGRLLGARRESSVGPPSTEPHGSVHNLQLDIMDDIVQSRKVRLKMWNTSNEKVCEVKDEMGLIQKYTGNRRYSDFVGTTLAPIPSGSRRRASELPPPLIIGPVPPVEEATRKHPSNASRITPGIICSNTDLISILSNLTASSTEIDQYARQPTKEEMQSTEQQAPTQPPPPQQHRHGGLISSAASTSCVDTMTGGSKVEKKGWEVRRARLRNNRSNSFDASILHKVDQASTTITNTGSEWFTRRHQPMATKFPTTPKREEAHIESGKKSPKVVWDGHVGSVVDPHVLGIAIEDFLRRDSQQGLVSQPPSKKSPQGTQTQPGTSTNKPKGWFASSRGSGHDSDDAGPSNTTCDSSMCASIKDLFVK